jgi:Fur family ferric uptake transcriptional regulator
MCKYCSYPEMLESRGITPTPLRVAVFSSIGDADRPLSAFEIITSVRSLMSINKVTFYRIVELLVNKGLVRPLPARDRSLRYGMGETPYHPDHPHFVCIKCGAMECLGPEMLPAGIKNLQTGDKRIIKRVDVRFEGICESCVKAGL